MRAIIETEKTESFHDIELLNQLYDKYQQDCTGSLHNALWQIIVNRSCRGAFVYIETEQQVGVAQAAGGYVPALFGIDDASRRKQIINELNMLVFNLTPLEADKLVAVSMKVVV